MSNSLDSFLTRIGDVTIERVTPRGSSRSTDPGGGDDDHPMKESVSNSSIHTANDGESDGTGGDISEGEHEKRNDTMEAEDIEEIHSEGSGDDMDLDETIDTEIGVRMDSERQQHSDSSCQDDDVDGVNILDTLPLEGAPIEGQEVSEADLLGKPLKDDDGESIDNDNVQSETQSGDEEDGKRRGDSDDSDPAKKKQRKDDGDDSECELKSEKKLANMRRNIREVMDEAQLDEATLAAQRQEMERLRRVQEQQKIIREVQRQMAINRQNNKTQTRVISLLQGKQNDNSVSTSISQSPPSSSPQVKLPSTVLLKVNSASAGGQLPPGMPPGSAPRRPNEGMRWQKGRGGYQGMQTSISRVPHRTPPPGQNVLQQRIRMMTPSVSISPVVPKKEPHDRSEYFSDSDMSDVEAEDIAYEDEMRKAAGLAKSPKPTKGKDVVTISSSSDSSDDDCIVLSDPSGGEETDNEDDPANSGMHTNDRYNIPDEHGRVLVNVGHPDTEPDVYLAPQVARIIKPHQIGGIRFLYDNIVESIERYKSSCGFGCILAHSMGLGKTLQVASFCDIFFRCTTAKTVLCIMPINTLQNWLAEFNMWLPYEDPNAVKPETLPNNFKTETGVGETKHEIKEENSNHTDMSSRPISTESAHRSMQEGPPGIPNMMGNPFNQQTYDNQNPMPNFYQDGLMNKTGMDPNAHMHQGYHSGMPQNQLFNPSMSASGEYKQMKQELDCTDMSSKVPNTNYGVDGNQSVGRPVQMQGQYSGVDNRGYPMMNNQGLMGSYQGYSNMPQDQSYGNNPAQMVQPNQEIKQEQSFEQNDANIKKEPKEVGTKDEGTSTIKEDSDVPKPTGKIEAPHCVDSPIGMELRPRNFRLHILNDSHKTMAARGRVIKEWQKIGGVLLIGYELYRQLSLKKSNKAKRKRGQPFKDTVDVEEEDKNKGLLEEMHGALVNPGPDLVICDEGHRIKNSHASISMALKQMRTKRRIVLTGYPLQNNLLEYWCMVDFVRPNYLGTKSEFCNMFERPIQNGQCIDSTPQDIRLMRYRAHVLHALLEGFVQRRSHSVLQVSLPRKEEYILLVRMTAHQRKLYDTFMNQVVKTRAVPNPLKAFAVCCKIWNHPDILFHFLRKRQANEEDDLDLEETMAEKAAAGGKRPKGRQPKGESKKGKKVGAAVKAKPAASVPPNSSSSISNENNEETAHTDVKGNFPNFSQPMANSNFPNAGQQQQTYPQGYQNYRVNEQNNYYRNDQNSGEYNEYYNNQGQQRYPNQTQPFQSYPQNDLNYGSSQNFPQNQPQGYTPAGDQAPNNTQKYPAHQSNTDFRSDQGNSGNYDMSTMYPRQPYGFQEQGRNYQPTVSQGGNLNQSVNQSYPQNPNQTSNYANPVPNQTNNTTMPDYSNYGQSNQSQNYSSAAGPNNVQQKMYPRNDNTNQSVQNQPIYPPNQQHQNAPSQQAPQSTGFMGNSASHSNQQNASGLMPSPGTNYPTGRPNQSATGIQNPTQGNTSNQMNPTMPNSGQPLYPPNQPNANAMSQNQSHGFIGNQQQNQSSMPQNPIRGYQTSQQNQYSTSQVQNPYPTPSSAGPSAQTHGYVPDQQPPIAPKQGGYQSSHHGAPATSQNSYQSSHSSQTPAPANQAHNYPTNQQTPMQNQSHRYPPGPQNQGNMSQNQPGYASTQNTGTPMGGTEQSNNMTGNYSMNQTQPQNPAMTNYPTDNSHANQFRGQDGQYPWQGNYSQPMRQETCNDQYFRDPSNNRYQNNYFPQQNYGQNSTYDYGDMKNTDNKASQQAIIARGSSNYDKNTKDAGASLQQSQTLPQSNIAPNSNYTGTNVAKPVQNMGACHGINRPDLPKDEEKEKDEGAVLEKEKEEKSDEEILTKDEEKDLKSFSNGREDPGIPYDWAIDLMKGYVPGLIDASAKMTLFFCILEESIRMGDRVLAFSQSLFTLNLIEDFLARNNIKYPDGQSDAWIKNVNYYRLDGSTSALEREKLINEFNVNSKIHLFLVSTRAGSLGINLVGANRAIVFDASWNPCHDTQAVCRVYRYGQTKKCYVYRLVTDNCLERKIYDRQISKQGMADRVVDQCNPDAHLSLKEATTLSWEWEEDGQVQDFSSSKDNYSDEIMQLVLERHSSILTKQPFHHESLLVDRKDKKLSQAEKRLARRGYELEKMAANSSKPSYNYVPGNTATRAGGLQIRAIRGGDQGVAPKPVASVRPMQQRGGEGIGARGIVGSRWIPAEVWQRQGMSAQEMTLPLDVVIPTNSPDKSSIVLKAGQRVMVLKSPKGIYMQLESGKIIAIRTALKINQQKREEEPKKAATSASQRSVKPDLGFPLRNNSAISIIPKTSTHPTPSPRLLNRPGSAAGFKQLPDKDLVKRPRAIPTPLTKPIVNQVNLTNQVSLQRLSKNKGDSADHSSVGENSNSSDSQPRTDQRVEEVRLEDIVAEASSNPDYSPANSSRTVNSDTETGLQRMPEGKSVDYGNPISAEKLLQGIGLQPPVDGESERPKDENNPTACESKDSERSSVQTSYGHRYSSQSGKEEHSNDEIIIEEPSLPSSTPHSRPAPPQIHQQQSQDVHPRSLPPSQPYVQRPEIPKNPPELASPAAMPMSSGANPPTTDRAQDQAEIPADPHGLPQAYPYSQFPRYYDYADPRSRGLAGPYGSYFPTVPTHSGNPRLPDATKQQPDVGKAPEERMAVPIPAAYTQPPSSAIPTPTVEISEPKNPEPTIAATLPNTTPSRTDPHIPTAFSHPASSRFTGTYPPAPYDPYSQHYPAAPSSSAAYPPSGAPGYAAYGGPTYNADYARMYSAFHGPPPAADAYMHRGYAPPSTHPSNPYYSPFPHPPPPPYPNYSFLPPYPNPNMPGESQPPTQ